jgi:hypothetical protein
MAVKVNEISTMPNMSGTLDGWMQPVTLIVLEQTIQDGFVQNKRTEVSFNATVQPLSPRQLIMKPESQRSFRWLQIHVPSGGQLLKPGEIIVFNSEEYRIMAQYDYDLNGYREYHALEKYDKPC